MYDQTTGTVLTLVFLGVILIFSRPIWHWIKAGDKSNLVDPLVARPHMGVMDSLADSFAHPIEYRTRVQIEQLTNGLEKLTKQWTQPLVMRTYDSNAKGEAHFAAEAALFTEHSYDASMMSEEGGHVHVGRLLLTGGLSVFAGKPGIRSGGKHTVTWKRIAAAAADASGPPGGHA